MAIALLPRIYDHTDDAHSDNVGISTILKKWALNYLRKCSAHERGPLRTPCLCLFGVHLRTLALRFSIFLPLFAILVRCYEYFLLVYYMLVIIIINDCKLDYPS